MNRGDSPGRHFPRGSGSATVPINSRHKAEVTGASFRDAAEIIELAECDLLILSPPLLGEFAKTKGTITRKLSAELAARSDIPKLDLDEKKFRWQFNEDAMATEKTAEGIRLFHADAMKLEKYIAERL